jgi:putative hydrolase of the HAD superfamily
LAGIVSIALEACLLRPLAISFDLDNTLFDRHSSLRVLASRLIESFPAALDDIAHEQVVESIVAADAGGYTRREQAMVALSQDRMWKTAPRPDQLWAFWTRHFPECIVPEPDLRPTLSTLVDCGLKLAIASNGWSKLQRRKLDALGVEDFFDVILIEEEVGIEKPDPRMFQLVSAALKISPRQIWHVGDHPVNDVLGSSLAGLEAVWMARTDRWPLDSDQPRMRINSLVELVSLVRGREETPFTRVCG